MKHLLIILACFFLASCDNTYRDQTGAYTSKPDYLKDCTITRLSSNNAIDITVVRCPNSMTSTTSKYGKSASKTVAVIDGVSYEAERSGDDNVMYIEGKRYVRMDEKDPRNDTRKTP